MARKKQKQPVRYIPEKTKVILWGKQGGRCSYCNRILYRDSFTQAEFNTAYIAHIVADSPDGPRGHPVESPRLKKDISNLTLMCDVHHRLIDEADVEGHTVDRLRKMKAQPEKRIERATTAAPNKQSEILLYGANVGDQAAPVNYGKACLALSGDRYPSSDHAINLSLVNSATRDHDQEYWRLEEQNLRRLVETQVQPRLVDGSIPHMSIFAIAPQPLLILLGSLLTDIPDAETYQLHREPTGWCWQDGPADFQYRVEEPTKNGEPALVLALSATVTDDRIQAVLGEEVAIWRVTLERPDNDFLKSRAQLRAFRSTMRTLLDQIKARHGQGAALHVFPVVPVAIAVDLGRIRQPKADLPFRVYDQNNALGGFAEALRIGE
jgi:hypothetical protein